MKLAKNEFHPENFSKDYKNVIQKNKHYIINYPWYRRRPLIVMRPHEDHKTNKKHRMTRLGWIVTAKEGEDAELFDLRREVSSFL